MAGRYVDGGLVVFTNRPCRSGDNCDQAYKPAELDALRRLPRRRRRVLPPLESELIPAPCPTPGCPVITPGGRLCHFDRRTEERNG